MGSYRGRRYVWLPRDSSTIFADGLLMAATLHMEEDPVGEHLRKKMLDIEPDRDRVTRIWLGEWEGVDLTACHENLLASMKDADENLPGKLKLMILMFDGSDLLRNIEYFKALHCDVEILTTNYKRQYSIWDRDNF